MRRDHRPAILAALVLSACRTASPVAIGGPLDDWPAHGRDPGGERHSPLTQITRENVGSLHVAWTYRTGDLPTNDRAASFEATPILVDGTLYLSTPFNRVIALDPETGRERWRFDPEIDLGVHYVDFTSRGVSTWLDAERKPGEACRRRIFLGTNDARLMALDAASGKRCADFGAGGEVDLSVGVGRVHKWEYGVSSPPAVILDLVVVGAKIADNQRADAPSGVVRAFDARSGKLRWSWNPVTPEASKEGDGRFRLGTANAWSVLSVDPERGLVFVPLGNASPDYFGGERNGSDTFSASVVALRASSGDLVWHFQTVHHDLWDYDVPAEPALITLKRDGKEIPALAQTTKVGHLFVLDRETGKSLFPVEERAVPATDVPGELTSPTQPVPKLPPPIVAQKLFAADAWGLTPWDRGACRKRIESLRYDGIFTPPSVKGSLMFPGSLGGGNWSGVSFDPDRNLLVTNVNNLPFVVRLIPRAEYPESATWQPRFELAPQTGTPFGLSREPLLSPLGLPCNPPPWGSLLAVDLSTGEIRWQVPLGTARDLFFVPLPIHFGTPNIGGAITTATGLVFIGAAMDNYLRAFDIEDGREVWKGRLPAGGQATPMTYRVREDGKQYVVIAAGGHGRLGTKLGDYVVAFSL